MASSAFSARRRKLRSSHISPQLLLLVFLAVTILYWYTLGTSLDSFGLRSRQSSVEKPLVILRHPQGEQTSLTTSTDQDNTASTHPSAKMKLDTQRVTMPLRVVTYNIRYATEHPVLGEHPWYIRCPKLATQLDFITSGQENSFICLQEALYSQVEEISEHLGTSWTYIGRGRGTNPEDGEFSPIFYRQDVWECERHETRWLSKTPQKPSRGWDAALNRIVTMGEFSHRTAGTRVVVMSTHFDHIGVQARQNSARLLIEFAQEWGYSQTRDPSVVLIGGDFNSPPNDQAYKTITASGSGISDISRLLPETRKYGNSLTYTSFGEPNEYPKRIDFLFIQEPRTAVVKTFGVLANSFDDHIRISDHRPVVADMDILIHPLDRSAR